MFVLDYSRDKIKAAMKKYIRNHKDKNFKENIIYLYNDLKHSKILMVVDVLEKLGIKLHFLEIPVDKEILNYIKENNLTLNNLPNLKILPSFNLAEDEKNQETWDKLKLIEKNLNILKEFLKQKETTNEVFIIFSYLPFYQFKNFLHFFDKELYLLFLQKILMIIDYTLLTKIKN